MRWIVCLFVLGLCSAPLHARGVKGEFDYWSMVLSWSPAYCQTRNGQRDGQQCGRGKDFAFVAHGLWPQYERGWPEYCARKPEWISRGVIATMTEIMPSHSLVIHEWKKHGTCSGLAAADYFALTRKIFNKIRIPARFQRPNGHIITTVKELKQAFIQSNPGLKTSMFSVQCGNRRDRANLRELRFCFSKKMLPRPCGANEKRACRAYKLVLPPVRGQ